MGVLDRLKALFRRGRPLFNLRISPAYGIKASRQNPYFQALERSAAALGLFGDFVVEEDGLLRKGRDERLPTRTAELYLDAYPNPAALEGRTVANYDEPTAPRRHPRLTLEMDDDTELFVVFEGQKMRVSGPALAAAREKRTGGGRNGHRLRGQARG